MCKRCRAVVIQLGYKRSGHSPMKNHLTSAQCAKAQFQKTSRQGIDKLLRNMVCRSLNECISLLISAEPQMMVAFLFLKYQLRRLHRGDRGGFGRGQRCRMSLGWKKI